MSVADRQKAIIDDFNKFRSWEERYKHVIDLGKELSPIPQEYYDNQYLVKGCQSRVWLHARLEGGHVQLFADSDAMIVKGLVAILLSVYSNASPDDILQNPPEFISELGFRSHLSPSRANGLMAMVKQIMLYAAAFKAMSAKV